MAKKKATTAGAQSSEPKQRQPRAKKAKLELVKDDAQQAEQPAVDQQPSDPAPFNPEISMRWDGDAELEWRGTLDALVRMNELDPMQDAEFIEEMRGALREHGGFTGGGGAAPVCVLRVVQSAVEPVAAEPATEPTVEEQPAPAPKRGRARKPKPSASMTLAELSTKFLAALDSEGKSDATVGAYRSDLAIAQRVLGADKAIDSILPADVLRFNDSDAVLLAKSGAPKASPTVERTRRVLRLALDYAECEGWIKVSPCGCEVTEIEA